MRSVLETIQQWLNGPFLPPDPELPKALADSKQSLEKALSRETEVSQIVQSVDAEDKRNHFIELLLYPLTDRGT